MIISKICSYAKQLETTGASAGSLADFIDIIAHCIALEHPLDVLADSHKELESAISDEPLPSSQKELKDRAIIYFIKGSLEEMLDQKQAFINGISDEERRRYWTSEHR